jgi:uncharacterized protein
MPQMIFVNLPVADLGKSTAFYEAIGAKKDERFSDDTASGMSFSEEIHVMLLTHDKFKQFTAKPIVDATKNCEVMNALSRDSREAVDAIVEQAAGAGGQPDPTPTQDFGFMYGRSFEDPDGHIWEVAWMDLEAFLAASAEGKKQA